MPTVMRALFLFFLLVLQSSAWCDTIIGKVVGVSDGDTITVLDESRQQYKIRLSGIDAPEKNQAFGQKSKANLSSLVYGKQVTVEWSKHDRYHRIIGIVSVGELNCNLEQVKAGMAWWYRAYAKEQSPKQRVDFEKQETLARSEKAGLWADPHPIAPWDWRRR